MTASRPAANLYIARARPRVYVGVMADMNKTVRNILIVVVAGVMALVATYFGFDADMDYFLSLFNAGVE